MEIIPTVKIVNRDGIKAVKNGQKANKFAHVPAEKKPSWIRVKASFDPKYKLVKEQVASKNSIQFVKKQCVPIFQSAGPAVLRPLC